jgi:BMFP domain-containing protein YqiC
VPQLEDLLQPLATLASRVIDRSFAVFNPPFLDELGRRLQALAAQTPVADLEKNARALLAGAFSRLDLVTREEFDAQARLLARTREQLEQLEARVAQLEARAAPPL